MKIGIQDAFLKLRSSMQMKYWYRGAFVCGTMVLLTSCGMLQKADLPDKAQGLEANASIVKNRESQSSQELVGEGEGKNALETQRIIYEHKGSQQFVNVPKARFSRASENKLQVNFVAAPLSEVIQVVFGDILKVPYTVEGEIKGNITLNTSSPVSEEALLGLLESLLGSRGIVMVHTDDGIYRLGTAAQLKKEVPVKLTLPFMKLQGYNLSIIPLEYISVLEAHKVLGALGAKENIIYTDPVRNILMIAASSPQLKNIQRTLGMFDVDVLEGMSFGVYEVFNLDAETVVERFNSLLGSAEFSPIAGLVKLVPMEELNSVMVITPRTHFLGQVRDWIERLDKFEVGQEEGAATQLYVYEVENGDAEHIAGLLTQLYSGMSKNKSKILRGGAAPNKQQKTIASDNSDSASLRIPQSAGGGNAGRPQIVPNIADNSILVMAEPKIWRSVKAVLKKLDAVPAQVLVEVSIWEVTLDNSLRYGVEWFFENEVNGGDLGVAKLDMDSGGINATVPGFSYLVNDMAGGWSAVINTLDKESRVDVLSSPSVLVLDNETAEINVGDQQPVRTGTTVTDGGTTTESIQYKDTGVRLKVSPRVNASGLVIMEIDQEVTDVGNIDTATGQRAFLSRNISSKVAIQSGDTIVLGGLIQENKSNGASGVPYISRVPVLGALFGTQTDDLKRTELLVTITPRAVTQYKDFNKIGEEFRKKMARVTETFDIKIP